MMSDTFTATELMECARREAKMRRHVYERSIEKGYITHVFADREVAMMEAIAEHFAELAVKERLL